MICLRALGLVFGYTTPLRAIPPLLNGLDLSVAIGEFAGLLGPNGAGKTTLLRLLAGILQPQSGTVSLFGRPLRSLRGAERARLMAFVPQGSRPAFDTNVLELVLMGRAPHLGLLGLEGRRDVEIAREALAFTDAEGLAERFFGGLSAGEKQRVLLARALAQQAGVVLLDEPTAFLDLAHQVQIFDLLARLRAERGTTVVIASHDLNLAGRFCDRVVMLKEGAVIAEGEPSDVLQEDRIRSVYGVDVSVRHEPGLGSVVIPRASRARPGAGAT